jgi:cytochrome c oxidase subunit 2
MKHGIGALIFVVILTIVGVAILRVDVLLPEQAALQAVPIDNLFNIHFKVIAFLFALIVGFVLYSIIFFRRKKGDLSDGAFIKENSTLEFIWLVVPLAAVLFFAFLGSRALAQTLERQPKPLEVKVIGQQWAWRFEYPDFGVNQQS